ncbi:hypothetical protein DFA_05621 [Cavenderia fasciculata]|uniref:Uncharacterized protein n=1 Tax=Cavenderia fasciculata TaxID=261658 RepID=F4PLR6_CACFS|nr:uncharacterized protein DFA_05621 [Cavenderia fasciculata]EGG23488.1 hypothetical protein DFA_05621 [Cavenderia fasciculata]|eukprot:XP_004361339.1 hypothetical protein DFA_05621 [Cavenderia fasciculata]
MKAALEEYNQNQGGKGSHQHYANQAATMPPLKSPDYKMDPTNSANRRRGATIIGGTRPDYLNSGGGASDHGGDYVNDHPATREDESYTSLKMKYLTSLNITIATPQKDQQVSASAPIPIPIPFSKIDDSDDESDIDPHNDDGDDDTFYKGASVANIKGNGLVGMSLNHHHHDAGSFMVGTPLQSSTFAPPPVATNNNNGEPVRKDSRSKKLHKFIPPHELLGKETEDDTINHSLPGNNRRKVFGQ